VTATIRTNRVARLTAGGSTLGLSLDRVFGIERADRVRPNSSPGTLGSIVNQAGEWVVIELAECLGLPAKSDRRNGQVVLVEAHGMKVGLLVDRVSSGERATADVVPMPRSVGPGGPYSGVLHHADGPLLMLDPERLLNGGDEPTPAKPAAPMPNATPRPAERMVLFAQAECALLGGRAVGFGVPAGCVTEVIDPPAGSPVPSGEPFVREVIAWRGQAVAVLDTARWCGVPLPAPASRRVVLVRTPGRETVGLLAGDGVKLLPLPIPHLTTRRHLDVDPDRVKGVFDLTHVTVVVPDLSALARGRQQ
jgi:chemotaxis signal transduction protein